MIVVVLALLARSSSNCTFTTNTDCTGMVIQYHDFGVDTDAQQHCCALCQQNPNCAVAVLATVNGGVCMLKPFGSTCKSGVQNRIKCAPSNKPPPPPPIPTVPKWTPTYNMSESTVLMPCNYSGLYDFEAYPALGKFGLVDYDWSNAKLLWDNQSPMDCDGMLVEQASRNKAVNPRAKVFVYRNIVKALPWYTEVRVMLQNISMWGFFLPYEGCRTPAGEYICKNNITGEIDASSNLYHDEEQTPGWTGGGDGGPDGVCHNDTKGNTGKGCDCGAGVSCGEYLWDHRNGSMLTKWFTEEYIGGSTYGLGNENVDGFYLDDHWTDRPSEENYPCSTRGTGAGKCAGLSKNETIKMQAAWQFNMNAVEAAIVENGGFDWQNFRTDETPDKLSCASHIRNECTNSSDAQTTATYYRIGYQYNKDYTNGTLTNFDMDLAVFLTIRGPYSWLGYGWMGCGCGWEHGGKMPCDIYQRPAALDEDYGVPQGLCTEKENGVFVRQWSKATVTVDCNKYTSDIKLL
eukprot:m.57998 g.57998  ORF g.57998 m.57998 type:complete len:517 (-) comp11147_c0_seq1:29-1579(-)